jgi:hypothetical protein
MRIITGTPEHMPNKWGTDRGTPKLSPDANIMMLFGPGVAVETNAKSKSALVNIWVTTIVKGEV